ncbi:unnamed protein product [Penicillium bialowiezense]
MGSLLSTDSGNEERGQGIEEARESSKQEPRATIGKILSKSRSSQEAGQGAVIGPQHRAIESQSASPREEVSTWGFGAKGAPRQFVSPDPPGWSTDPKMLCAHQWSNEGSRGQELGALSGLTNCRPVLANESQTILESNGVFFLSDRRNIYVQEIESRDLNEIKMALHNHGVDALNLCAMTSKAAAPAYRSSRRRNFR